jgi:hypothetical protein
MGNLRVKQANIYLYIPSLIAMLSIWPVASIEYFTYDSDFRDQVSLKEWLVGYDFYFYVHNFLNIVAPTILLFFCLVFIHKYLVSVILTAVYYVATLISLANYIFSDKFFDSSFSIFGKLKYYFGFYEANNIIFNFVHFLQSLLTLILPLLAVLVVKSISGTRTPLAE